MDWPYPCGDRRPFSYLVDATAFRSLTLGRIPDPFFKPKQGIEGPPAVGIATNQHFLQRRHNDVSHDDLMERIAFLLVVVGTLAGVVASSAASGHADEAPTSIFGGALLPEPRLEVDLRSPRRRQPQRFAGHSG